MLESRDQMLLYSHKSPSGCHKICFISFLFVLFHFILFVISFHFVSNSIDNKGVLEVRCSKRCRLVSILTVVIARETVFI